jgi:hypothetical protein
MNLVLPQQYLHKRDIGTDPRQYACSSRANQNRANLQSRRDTLSTCAASSTLTMPSVEVPITTRAIG